MWIAGVAGQGVLVGYLSGVKTEMVTMATILNPHSARTRTVFITYGCSHQTNDSVGKTT